MACLDISAPARPDAGVAGSRAYIPFIRLRVSDEIDAFHAFKGRFPVEAAIADKRLYFVERQINILIAREGSARLNPTTDYIVVFIWEWFRDQAARPYPSNQCNPTLTPTHLAKRACDRRYNAQCGMYFCGGSGDT